MTTLGVTGGIASGKTTVCNFLRELGAKVFDADSEAKDILFNNLSIQNEIEKKFGIKVSTKNSVDTEKLAQVAFSNKQNQIKLNNIIHPKVEKRFKNFIYDNKSTTDLIVGDIALLFESELDLIFNYTLLVYTDYSVRESRAMKRSDMSKEQFVKRDELQMSEDKKKHKADFVIYNNGTIKQLKEKVTNLYNKLMDDN